MTKAEAAEMIVKLRREIKVLKAVNRSLRENATRITPCYGGEAVSHTRNVHSMADAIDGMVDNERLIRRKQIVLSKLEQALGDEQSESS